MNQPWLLPALGFAAGVLLVEFSGVPSGTLALGATTLFLLARHRNWPVVFTVAGWGFAGGLAWWIERTPLSPTDLRVSVADGAHWVEVFGEVTQTPELRLTEYGGRTRPSTSGPLRVTSWREAGMAWQPGQGTVMTRTRGVAPEGIFPGQWVVIQGVIQLPPKAVASGLFDYQAHLRSRGVSHLLEAESFADWQVKSASTVPWSAHFLPWARRALSHGLPDNEPTRLLWAMTLGWRTPLNNEAGRAFIEAGTIHIFAISGLHIALLVGVLVALMRLIRINRVWCGLVVIPISWFYVAVTGWQPSAVRSAVMMTVVVGGWTYRRPANILNSLALAALTILIFDPGQLFQAGFQLSFAAVAGLSTWTPGLGRFGQRWLALRRDPFLPDTLQPRWRSWIEPVQRGLVQSLAVTLAALIATLPLTVHYFHVFSPVSLAANIVVVPLSGLALAANVGSLATYEWLPSLAGLFNASAWLWMSTMAGLSRWFAGLPGAFWFVARPPWYWWAIYGVFVGAPWWSKIQCPKGRRVWFISGLSLVLVGLVHSLDSRRAFELAILPGGVVVVDGPGSAHDMVLNTGGSVNSSRVLLPWLQTAGWNRLPLFAITQADVAHSGGATNLLRQWRPNQVLTGARRQRSPVFREFLRVTEQAKIPIREVYRGDQVGSWSVLSPAAGDSFRTAADNSLVLTSTFEGFRFLILPELGTSGRESLMERALPELEELDIVIAEISERNARWLRGFLDQVKPRLVILNESGSERKSWPPPGRWVRRQPAEMIVLERADAAQLRLGRGQAEIISLDGVRQILLARRHGNW